MIVAVVVLVNVASGGMRSITFVQAFQYWLKLTALLVPACFLLAVWDGDGAPNPADAAAAPATPSGRCRWATAARRASTPRTR